MIEPFLSQKTTTAERNKQRKKQAQYLSNRTKEKKEIKKEAAPVMLPATPTLFSESGLFC